MHSLIRYESAKIRTKRDFLLSVLFLLFLNLFILWYTNLPDEMSPPLSAYRDFQAQISKMTESEKALYMESWKETLDTMAYVQEVLTFRQMQGETGKFFLSQALESRPGVFEKYYDSFQNNDYLRFTDSFYQESVLAEELYKEWQKVSGYGEYLRSIQENKEILENISIFSGSGSGNRDSFSSGNMKKSAADYEKLTDSHINWAPGKPLVCAMESIWTDLLLLLFIFLPAGNLIFPEKEKNLLSVTRSTKRGIYPCILSKLTALLLYCIFITFLLYGSNLLFYGVEAGLGSVKGFLNAPVQSVAAYMESSLSMTTGQFIFACILTRGLALFGVAALLTALCIPADNIFFPYGITGLFCGLGWILYLFFPAGTKLSAIKYLNPAGIMRAENLYGRYLNFNLFGYPVSRTASSLVLLAALLFTGVFFCLLFYGQGKNLTLKSVTPKSVIPKSTRFLPSKLRLHPGLWRQECRKIMISGRALPVLLVFLLLIGYKELTREYHVSVKEEYYRDLCLTLEGELTAEKENMILKEKERFREAFDSISRIDEMISAGRISETAGEDLKAPWYAVTAFYPSFQRIWQQYRRILDQGGYFIYDTGYLYLLGVGRENFTTDLLLLTLCAVFAFGNCLSSEYQNGTWRLLNTSLQGKRKVFARKTGICLLTETVISAVPFLSRAVNPSASFPLHGLLFPVNQIPFFGNFPQGISVAAFLVLFVLSQAASLIPVTLGVIFLSGWRKDYVQTVFFSLLFFGAPLLLKLLGFDFAGWFSVYPLYAWTEML